MKLSGLSLSVMNFFFLLQIFWVISAYFSARVILGNETDKLSLLEFKDKIDSDPFGFLSSWNESVHFCSWPGITCSRRHQRVIMLDVTSRQLKGRLSPHIGNLSFLRELNLPNNSFSLTIPPEIGRLFRLQVLDFGNNSFSGEIPANISGCTSLRFLRIFSNNLTGRIPKDIGLLSELRIIVLSRNNLVGEIPASIGNISSLVNVYLATNKLEGAIPDSLGRMKSLRVLVISINNLSGTVPLSLFNVSTIEVFSVYENQLEGSLPPNLGHTLPNLQYFFFDENNFSGPIPSTVSNASDLVVFQILYNNFTGKVPSFSSSLNLNTLGLSFNNLGYAENGDLNFLHDLVNSTNLELLNFAANNLGGAIPEAISNMTSTRLRQMALGQNQISGNIPTGIGNLLSLELFGLELNRLTGPIPSTIGKLRKMYFLTLDDNEFSGEIPSTLGNLTSLGILSLARNNIEGSIPPSLGECKNLQALTLAENNLSGPIPSQIIRLSSLSQFLDLSRNHLTGSIPLDVRKLVNLGRLDFSENKLSGEIPSSLGSCRSMEYLCLQGNFLQGSIPEELKSLVGVQKIDLSRNKLSGKIPDYFADFRGLVFLNLSFNDFEGQVPQLGVFKNASEFSIEGNMKLCGGLPELKLQSCTTSIYKNHKLSLKKKSVIIVACAIIALIIIFFLATIAFRSRKRRKPILEPPVRISLPRVSYGDLSKATDGFSSKNLIGVGSFGSVYKGILSQQDKLVAVKVLNLHVSRALKSFLAECESLGIIRHRNLVKLLTVCSSIDFQGNDFKALVCEFMENGNLEEWLHSVNITINPRQEQRPCLSLIQRVDIAIDIASALDYLHNHSHEPIVHCDIKPSNILLDGHMVAHVGDFGLAKLLGNIISPSSSNQTSSTGIRGTVGYVAPEYAMGSEVSTLGDVYSYGILLLEMFTGKRPTDSMFKDELNLHNFALMGLPDRISEIVDPMLLEGEDESTENDSCGCDDQDQMVHKSLISIIEIGIACSSDFPVERKNMGEVAAELRHIRDTYCRIPQNRVSKAKGSEAPLLSGD